MPWQTCARARCVDAPSCARKALPPRLNKDMTMASDNLSDWTRFNPIAYWRDWIVRSEEQWSAALSSVMKDERTGSLLNRQADELPMMHRMFSEMA